VDARPGAIVELGDGAFGVVLSRGAPMPGDVAIDLWYGGAVIVAGDEEVELVSAAVTA
jgi:hypothetical protein